MANAPALNLATGEFYLTLRMPGSATTSLVAMKYDPTEDEFGQASVKELWRTDIDGSSVQSAPALSADGNTVYVLDAHNTIWALDTADGAARWSHPLDFTAARTLSVSADGLIIPAPATTGPLIALQDNGDGAAVKWRRADLPVVGPTSIAANSRGYVAIRDGAHPLTVMAIDLSDGQTVSRAELPGDASASAVTLIAPGEQLATLTADGGMYVFD